MNIAHVISSGGYYGAENALLNLCRGLRSLGHNNVIAVFSNAHRVNHDVADVARSEGFAVELVPCRGKADWNATTAIGVCAKKHGADVLHSNGYKSNLYALAAARQCDVPVVSTCHNWTFETAALRVYKFVDGMCLQHFDKTVAVSQAVAEALRQFGVSRSRIAVIANGVDTARFRDAQPTIQELRKREGLLVGTVAQLLKAKGHEYLLHAAVEIVHELPDTRFIFAGDGPSRQDLERLAAGLGIAENVIFLGTRRDIAGIYAALDIVVLPSLNEGLPMTILEAMAARKAVIATSVGDIPTLVQDGETGLLVRPTDVTGLRTSVLRLMQDARLRADIAAAGCDHVERYFSSTAMARSYESMYLNVRRQCAVA
jgi:glycosyltransferase involved in cell wall biosynthesis